MNEKKYNYSNINDYKSAFECFQNRFFVEKKSIFRLDDDEPILNEDSIKYLLNYFVNNGYGGKATFIDKIKHQLVTSPQEKTHIKNALEVLAHAVWLWRLVPSNSNIETTISSIQEILDLDKNFINIELKNNPFFKDIKGIAKTGTYYNTNKPFELIFVIKFLEDIITNSSSLFIDKLLKLEKQNISITTKGELDKSGIFKEVKSLTHNLKTASIFNALLHFFEPNKYEAILSNTHKEKIIETFKDLIQETENDKFEPEIDWKLYKIRKKIDDQFKGIYFYYQAHIRKLWDGDSIEINKNVIYYGVPGTGKTYDVLKEVRELTNNDDKYYKLVQFHPSYGYEDFIDGVKPIGNNNGNLQLGLVNGIFKDMCIDAYKELESNKENPENAKKFYFIADEINRAELSRVFGELLLCLEDDKRLRFDDGILKGELIKTQNSSLWEAIHAVVNKGETLYFGVPENIYFIGTMNDVDRSIESFDLALRRRFVWIKKETNYKVVEDVLSQSVSDKNAIQIYIKSCENLNAEIGKLIGTNYQLGHSYFLKIVLLGNIIPNISKKILFQNELKPILNEYLRSVFDESNIAKHLEDLENKFISKNKKDTNNDTNS